MLDKTRVAFNAFWWDGLRTKAEVSRIADELAALGYRGVEWKETCFGAGDESCKLLRMAVEATRESGLEVTDFVILRNLTDFEQQDRVATELGNFIRASAAAGIGIVNTASGSVISKGASDAAWWEQSEPDWQKSWDTLTLTLEKVLEVAEVEGVVIALEAIVGSLVHDYYSTLELLRRLDSPSLGLTFDPSHYLLHRNDLTFAMRSLIARIKHIHVKDALGRPGILGEDFLFPLLGEGGINWQSFFETLDELDYSGWLSLEFESFKYMGEVLKGDALEAARLSLNSYKALI